MHDFVIVTDSSADLPASLVQDMGVEVLPLSFTVQGKTYHNYPDDREMDPKVFYKMLRDGEMATTSAVNVAEYTTRPGRMCWCWPFPPGCPPPTSPRSSR